MTSIVVPASAPNATPVRAGTWMSRAGAPSDSVIGSLRSAQETASAGCSLNAPLMDDPLPAAPGIDHDAAQAPALVRTPTSRAGQFLGSHSHGRGQVDGHEVG